MSFNFRTQVLLPLIVMLALFATSCNSYQKVVKSDDWEYKYNKAIEFYNKGAYYKAIPVIEDLLVYYKGTEKAEELYFYYSNCHFQQNNFTISAYHFKNYVSQYPYSDRAAESLYLYALSHYNMSPERSLDQEDTYKAIEAFQVFINTYPDSEKVADANTKIASLRDKLEKKALENADLYYRTSSFRAASNEYLNILVNYPDIENAEEISWKALKASFMFADNSTFRRQVERFEETLKVYKDFVYKYPDSKFRKDADKIFEESNFRIIRSSYNHAVLSLLKDREKMLRTTINLYERHFPKISDQSYAEEAKRILESSYFMIVKTNYQLAQNSTKQARSKWYSKTINSYFNFIDKYSSSKFANEAEKIYEASTENLNKIKNG